jgi:hypothetical protein
MYFMGSLPRGMFNDGGTHDIGMLLRRQAGRKEGRKRGRKGREEGKMPSFL